MPRSYRTQPFVDFIRKANEQTHKLPTLNQFVWTYLSLERISCHCVSNYSNHEVAWLL